MVRPGRTVYPIPADGLRLRLLQRHDAVGHSGGLSRFSRRSSATFAQISLIALVFQMTSSPAARRRTAGRPPSGYSLAVGIVFHAVRTAGARCRSPRILAYPRVGGLIGCARRSSIPNLAGGAAFASGRPQRELAQSIFQVGGNAGSAMGPLLAALIVIPVRTRLDRVVRAGRTAAIFILVKIGNWYKRQLALARPHQIMRRSSAAGPGIETDDPECARHFWASPVF